MTEHAFDLCIIGTRHLGHRGTDLCDLINGIIAISTKFSNSTAVSLIADLEWLLDNGIPFVLRVHETGWERSLAVLRAAGEVEAGGEVGALMHMQVVLSSDRDAVLFKLFRR